MKKSTFKRLLSYTKPYKGFIFLTFLSAFVTVSFTLLAPVLIGKAVDSIIGIDNVDFNRVLKIIAFLAASVLLTSLFQWLTGFCSNIITNKTVRDLRIDVFGKLNRLPVSYIDSHAHGDMISRVVTDIDQIGEGLLQGFTQLFSGVLTIAGTLIFMLLINVPIALLVFFLTPISFFVASFIAKGCHKMFSLQSETRGELAAFAQEIIGNGKTVRAFGREKDAQNKFEEINGRLAVFGQRAQFFSALVNPSTRFVNGIVYAAVGISGALFCINGYISVGELSAFLTYANQYTRPFNEISAVVTELQNAAASAERVFEIIDQKAEDIDKGEKTAENPDGSVAFENVYFSYNKKKKLIEDFNLEVKPGQTVALVGPTGCGKTTLINLLMRFYETDGGRIKISGTDIRQLPRENLRNMFGMVLQDTWLFDGTVFENIAYGKEDATMEEVVAAAKKAHAHSFIKRLPDGYNTRIGEDGGSLSGGEKQLLSIARVMLLMPPMLILDEATSSIDTMTEMRVQKAFMELMRGRTSFVVAHRLSTVREADVIIVMKDGKIIEKGSHNELLGLGGFYADLYNSQFAAV